MDRQAAISLLRQHRARLKALGVEGVSLFGSVSRNASTDESDIDVAVRLSEHFSAGGFDYFAKLDALRDEFVVLLGREVDVVEEPVRAARLQEAIDRDRIVAFN